VKIAFVSQPWAAALPPSESVSIWNREVARRLGGDHEVVIYGRGAERGVEVEEIDGVEYRRVAAELDWRLLKATRPLTRLRSAGRPMFASYLFHSAYLAAVARDVRRLRPDVCHVHNFSQLLPLLRRASPDSGLVIHMHCEWLSQLEPRLVGRRLRHADLILGCSEHITGRIRAAHPARADRCATIHNGVDVDIFRPDGVPETERVLFVGRVAPDKGLHVLAEAWERVRRPGTILELIGEEAPVPLEMQVALSDDERVQKLRPFYEGSYVEALRAICDAIELAGKLPYDELPDRYRRASVLVNPSLEEAFGMSLVEAMACGVPVVATRVGGMPEIVADGETGFLIDPNNPDALASALERLLTDESLRRTLGAAARRAAVARFGWDRIVDQLRGRYAQAGLKL
jgi:spore coat protein SA